MFGCWTRAKRWRSLKIRCLSRTCTTRRLGWSCANPTRPGLRPRPKWGKDLALRSSNFSWAILVSHRTTNAKLSLFLPQETFLRFNHTLGYFSFSPAPPSLSSSSSFFHSLEELNWTARFANDRGEHVENGANERGSYMKNSWTIIPRETNHTMLALYFYILLSPSSLSLFFIHIELLFLLFFKIQKCCIVLTVFIRTFRY